MLPDHTRSAISSRVLNGSYSGIIKIYSWINSLYEKQPVIILKIIQFLENNRLKLHGEVLNDFIDRCMEKYLCLSKLENQQADVDYFDQLEKNSC